MRNARNQKKQADFMLTDYPDMNQSQMSCSYKDQQTKLRELLREKQDAYRKKARYQI
jgi:hypothetical protein